MLTFEMRKTKSLSMPILVEGIQQEMLRFKFVVEVNGVDYGFKAKTGGDNVEFQIPPLETIIKGLKEGSYNAKLEVSAITEGDRGFYMQPWAEQIRVKQSVNIEVAPVVEEKIDEVVEQKVKLKITSIFTESDGEPEPIEEIIEENKGKKNDKLRKKFK